MEKIKNLIINESYLKKEILGKCIIEEGSHEKIMQIANCYKDVFNGSTFYENWTFKEALEVIREYFVDKADISLSSVASNVVGFMVSADKVPVDQKEYIKLPTNELRFLEEIGVSEKYRGYRIATEFVRLEILYALLTNKRYLTYRTNMMRYFKKIKGETFEKTAERIQVEDKKKRKLGEKIMVSDLTLEEKQEFTNEYINMIKKRNDLDVSNSNRLMKSIFGVLEYNGINGNYVWQKDATGENNDRIFPYVDLAKVKKI